MRILIRFAVLLTLLLVAPIAFFAQSESPAPPPAAQTEADTHPDDSSTRAPAATAPLIERARYAAFQFSQKLPNFICQEYMARNVQRGQDSRPLDIVQAEVVYNNGQESYRNIKVGGRPTDKGMMEVGGSRSTGEFSSMLLDLFASNTDAQFQGGSRTVISGSIAQVYDFQVRQENSHWQVEAESQKIRPAYKGSVWVDPATARVLRIETQATDLPPDFQWIGSRPRWTMPTPALRGTRPCCRCMPRPWAVGGAVQTAAITSSTSATITNSRST